MKKLLCSLLLITTIFISGCGKKELTPEELLQQMESNMQEFQSLTAKMSMNLDVEDAEERVAVDFEIDVKAQEKSEENVLMFMDIGMQYGGVGINFDTYFDINNTDLTVYMQNFVTNNEYIKMTEAVDESESTDEETEFLEEFLNSDIDFDMIINELESDIEDTRKLEIIVTNEEIKKIVKQYEDFSKEKNPDYVELTEEDLKLIASAGDIKFVVYIDNDCYLRKIEMDFTGIFSNMLNSNYLEESEVKINSFKMTYEFSDYNKTTVEIPQEVIDNAVEETLDEDFYLEDYSI